MGLSLISNAFKNNSEIPTKYTCDGENISPPLEWNNTPDETQSCVLIMDDPDAANETWNHWIIYNIQIGINKLEEGIKILPKAAKLGENSWKIRKYRGPCPSLGEHRYYFKLYALNKILPLIEGASKSQVENAMEHYVLDHAVLIGRYTRIRSTSYSQEAPLYKSHPSNVEIVLEM